MAKITSKRQVTIPKHIADEYGIGPGDEISWVAEGGAIRVLVGPEQHDSSEELSVEQRLDLFDRATARQHLRQRDWRRSAGRSKSAKGSRARGWSREELYDRGLPR